MREYFAAKRSCPYPITWNSFLCMQRFHTSTYMHYIYIYIYSQFTRQELDSDRQFRLKRLEHVGCQDLDMVKHTGVTPDGLAGMRRGFLCVKCVCVRVRVRVCVCVLMIVCLNSILYCLHDTQNICISFFCFCLRIITVAHAQWRRVVDFTSGDDFPVRVREWLDDRQRHRQLKSVNGASSVTKMPALTAFDHHLAILTQLHKFTNAHTCIHTHSVTHTVTHTVTQLLTRSQPYPHIRSHSHTLTLTHARADVDFSAHKTLIGCTMYPKTDVENLTKRELDMFNRRATMNIVGIEVGVQSESKKK